MNSEVEQEEALPAVVSSLSSRNVRDCGRSSSTKTRPSLFSSSSSYARGASSSSQPSMLSNVASPIAFESHPLDLFRHKLSASLTSVVRSPTSSSTCTTSTSTNDDGWMHYNEEWLIHCLQAIDWEDLCHDYDHRHYSKEEGADETQQEHSWIASTPSTLNGLIIAPTSVQPSPLKELLTLLCDPCVWPDACHGALLQVLVSIVLERSESVSSHGPTAAATKRFCGTTHRPSLQVVRQVLVQQIVSRWNTDASSLRHFSAVVVTWIRQPSKPHAALSNDKTRLTTLNSLRRLWGLVHLVETSLIQKKHSTSDLSLSWMIRQPVHVLVLVEILALLDRLDPAKLDRIDHENSDIWKRRLHNTNIQPQQHRPIRRNNGLSAQQATNLLHGEMSDKEEDRVHQQIQKRFRRLDARSAHDWHILEDDDSKSSLTKHLDALRSKCVKRLVKALADNLVPLALQYVTVHPWSPSLRLAIVMALSQHPHHHSPQYSPHRQQGHLWQELLNGLWDCILLLAPQPLPCTSSDYVVTAASDTVHQHDQTLFVGLLHYYGELVGDGAWFHHDHPRLAMAALMPLLRAILSCDPHGINGTEASSPTMTCPSATAYRCCLVYIWSRKGRSIVEPTLQRLPACHSSMPNLASSKPIVSPLEMWQHMILKLDQWQYWYHDAWHTNRFELQLALQAAGIISVCEGHEHPATDPCASSQSTSSTSFHYPVGIRDLASRLSLDATLLSKCFSMPNYDSELSKRTSNITPADEVPPIRLNADLIQHILSYLGYKRLVRMRLVNHEWKTIADHNILWHQAYQSRYGFHPNDPMVSQSSASNDICWKPIFIENWIAERPLRFRRNMSSGFKVRLCRFVGCHQVLTTSKQAQRHEALSHATPRKRTSRTKRMANDASTQPNPSARATKKTKKDPTIKTCNNS